VHHAAGLKLLGDVCMAAFVDPLDCLAFAQDFRSQAAAEGFDTRAGIDIGRIELLDGEIIGTAPHRASCLLRQSARGELAMSPVMRDLVGLSESEGSRDRPGSSPDRATVR
jgi:class 3 adenylate cyclase